MRLNSIRSMASTPDMLIVVFVLLPVAAVLLGASFGFGLYILPLAVLGLLALSLLLVSAIWRPEWILAAMIASIPLTNVSWDAGFQVFTLPEVLLYVAIVGWLTRMILVERKGRIVQSPLNLPIAALVAVYAVSYLRVPDLVLSSYAFGANKMLYGIILSALIYFLVANNVKSKNVRHFSLWLLVAGVVASLIGFYQYSMGQVIPLPEVNRLTSTLGVGHGGFMVYVFLLGLGLMWGVKSKRGRGLLVILMLLFLSQIFLTALRSAWISLTIVLLMGWLLVKKNFGLVGMTAIAGGLTILAIAAIIVSGSSNTFLQNPYFYRLYSGIALQDTSSQSRFLNWVLALGLIKQHPLLGVGLMGFREYYMALAVIPPELRMGERGISAHNMYLDTALQVGVIGLAILLWLLIVALRQAYDLFRIAKVRGERGFALAILLMILHLLVWGMFDSPLLKVSANNFPFFAVLGLLTAKRQELGPRRTYPRNRDWMRGSIAYPCHFLKKEGSYGPRQGILSE